LMLIVSELVRPSIRPSCGVKALLKLICLLKHPVMLEYPRGPVFDA